MKPLTWFVVGFLLVVGSDAYGGTGWTNAAQITELNQQPANGVGASMVFVETQVTTNPSGCAYTTGFYFTINDDRTKRMFAMLMSAQLAGRNVRIYVTGNCHNPWTYSEMDGVVID